ncbi:MAG: hypothetical protein P8K83_00955 [Woeseiaceae bacterium]|nr:hypothetical protein [Woeseiaceae bacterium]
MAETKILVNAVQSLARSGVTACVRNAGGKPHFSYALENCGEGQYACT